MSASIPRTVSFFRAHRPAIAASTFLIALLLLLDGWAHPEASSETSDLAYTARSSEAPAASENRFGPRRHHHDDGLFGVSFSAAFDPQITAIKVGKIINDDGDGIADPGETIRYTVTISNTGDMDATVVTLDDTVDDRTTLVPGSQIMVVDDFYQATGNVGISVPAGSGVLVNDADPDGGPPSLTVTNFDATSTNGGKVNVAGDGGFTYDPPPGFEGTDTFTYEATDGDGFSATTAVAILVSDVIWFINNDPGAPPGNDGRLNSPFNALAAFETVNGNGGANDPEAGDCIFVHETGNGDYTSGVTLENNQDLLGQGATVPIDTFCNVTLPPFSNPLPGTSGSNPTIANAAGNGISLGQSNVLRGLDVGDTPTGVGIVGTNFVDVEIVELSLVGDGGLIDLSNGFVGSEWIVGFGLGAPGDAVKLNNVSGSFAVTGSTQINGAGGDGIDVSGSPGLDLDFSTIDIDGASGVGIRIDGGVGDFDVSTSTEIDGGGGGIRVSNSAGDTFDFGATSIGQNTPVGGTGIDVATGNTGASFDFNLDITTSAGPGLVANNSGTININSTASTINATGGAAVDITSTAGQTNGSSGWTFASLTSSTSPTEGIKLSGLTDDFTVTGTTDIDDAANEGIEIDASGASVDYSFATVDIDDSGGNGIDLDGIAGTFTIASNGGGVTFSSAANDHGVIVNNSNSVSISGTDPGGGATCKSAPASCFTIDGAGTSADAVPANGVTVTDVTSMSLSFIEITDVGEAGNTNADNEDAINVDDGTGTFSLTDSYIHDLAFETDAFESRDTPFTTGYSGTVTMTFTDNIIEGNGADHTSTDESIFIDFRTTTGATLLCTIEDNIIDGVRAGPNIDPVGNSGTGAGGRNVITIAGNTIQNLDSDGIGPDVGGTSVSLITIGGPNASDGNILDAIATAAYVGADPDEAIEVELRTSTSGAVLDVIIQNNTIRSTQGGTLWDDRGITVESASGGTTTTGTIRALIQDNSVDDTNDEGIAVGPDESITMEARVIDNTLGNNVATAGTDEGILARIRETGSDAPTLSVFFSGNESGSGAVQDWEFNNPFFSSATFELGCTNAGGGLCSNGTAIGSSFGSATPASTIESILDGEGNTTGGGGTNLTLDTNPSGGMIDLVDESTISTASQAMFRALGKAPQPSTSNQSRALQSPTVLDELYDRYDAECDDTDASECKALEAAIEAEATSYLWDRPLLEESIDGLGAPPMEHRAGSVGIAGLQPLEPLPGNTSLNEAAPHEAGAVAAESLPLQWASVAALAEVPSGALPSRSLALRGATVSPPPDPVRSLLADAGPPDIIVEERPVAALPLETLAALNEAALPPEPYAIDDDVGRDLIASASNDLDALALTAAEPALPTMADLRATFSARSRPAVSGETFSIPVGALAPGQTATIHFDVTVDAQTPPFFTQVCNQGTVSGTNFSDVLTDDPATGTSADETCTLAALDPGTIIIEKETNPGGGTGFGFTDDVEAPNSFTLNDGGTKTFSNITPGAYLVTEDDPSGGGFLLTVLDCVDNDSGGIASTTDLGNRKATINLDSGETVTCTFTNTEIPLDCPDDILLSNYQTAPSDEQFVDVTNVGAAPISIDACSHVSFNVFTQGAIGAASVALSGTLAPGESFRLGSAGAPDVDTVIPDGALPFGPGALGILDGPPPPDGTPMPTVLPDVITSMIYLSPTTVFGYAHFAVPAHEAIYECLYGVFPGTLSPFTPVADCLGPPKQGSSPATTVDFMTLMDQARALAAGEEAEAVPASFSLAPNYPNPFNPETVIRFGLPEASEVKLVVYDVLGRQVRVLVDGTREAGMHEVVFEARGLPSGTYVYRLETPAGTFVQRMLLVK